MLSCYRLHVKVPFLVSSSKGHKYEFPGDDYFQNFKNFTYLTYIHSEHFNSLQAKMRMRKKVTMIAITVSVIFGVCWLVDSINYTMYYFFPSHAFLSYAASSIMLLFNSAVNPIVYALVNQKFRRKFKAMLCLPQRIHHQQATADASIPAASAGGEKTE